MSGTGKAVVGFLIGAIVVIMCFVFSGGAFDSNDEAKNIDTEIKKLQTLVELREAQIKLIHYNTEFARLTTPVEKAIPAQ